MVEAFFVKALKDRAGDEGPLQMHYVAMVDTPEEAVRAVRKLVSEGTELQANGTTLSPVIARAIGLKPGQAKLV
jgi:hypothetical protein